MHQQKAVSLPAALVHSKHPRLLLHELHLLAQLLYKANAQFRATKWVQSVRAIEKCGNRIFAQAPHRPRRRTRASSRKQNVKAGTSPSFQSNHHQSLSAGGVFGKVHTRASATFPSTDSTQSSGSSAGTTVSLCSASMGQAMWQSSKPNELHKSVQDLIALLRHLAERSTTSYALISAHLCTPPAPTFAPLATALLGVCAQCGQVATAWADTLDNINWDRSQGQPTFTGTSAQLVAPPPSAPIDTS